MKIIQKIINLHKRFHKKILITNTINTNPKNLKYLQHLTNLNPSGRKLGMKKQFMLIKLLEFKQKNQLK